MTKDIGAVVLEIGVRLAVSAIASAVRYLCETFCIPTRRRHYHDNTTQTMKAEHVELQEPIGRGKKKFEREWNAEIDGIQNEHSDLNKIK